MSEFWLHPSLLLLAGAALLPWVPAPAKKAWLLIVPVAVFLRTIGLEPGNHGAVRFLEWTMVFGRVDALSRVFGFVMALMCAVGTLYGLHVRDDAEHVAAWAYVAGSLGAIYAGDYLTLFLFWELMALASVFLVWFRRRDGSNAAGLRYFLVHTAGGLSLLMGIVLLGRETGGDLSFVRLDVEHPGLPAWLILGGFLLNAAVPPLHAWLPDAYGEATPNGSVFLCAFTTKTAVYALCRGFAGMEILVPLGVAMALYGVVYAVLENDCRRLLAYHIVSQVGYMVAGVGLGTELAINGACAHAFAHILYKGLLFMGCGAVLHMTGRSKFTELGGLYRRMPWTFVFTLIGGLSISAFPLFSGFVSKSMIVAAGFEEHRLGVGYLLMLASVGTFLHTGLKVPYFIWFGERRCSDETWNRAAEPPWNMGLAMALASILCVFIGCRPGWLYGMLPHPAEYRPYTSYHVSETLLVLLFTAVGFFLLIRKLAPEATISVDLDWFYRKGGRLFLRCAKGPLQFLDDAFGRLYRAAGLAGVKGTSGGVSWFDGRIVDALVDGIGAWVRGTGGWLRGLQRGSVQESLLLALGAAALVLLGFLILR
ncbi:MAG: Na(+)/H(+) antiporter subunit D [Verrucomicrobiales bacterium]|nr:Na(+)/H(+) antiporter subunit D [Verrucomicrobiales bacterium]